MSDNLVVMGTVYSLLAGLGTGVGAVLVYLIRTLSKRIEDGLLSLAAGIMLAASVFSLILPGIDYGLELGYAEPVAVAVVIAGLLLGAIILFVIHNYVPHEHFFIGREGPDTRMLSRVWLFVIAITLHNFPEGMAVGVGFGGGNIANGQALALGIGLQNIPEGLAVAASMLTIGYTRTQAFAVAFLTGLAEPVGGFFGSVAVGLTEPLLPWALGFAAGAMLFIISDEIIPETHRGHFQNLATFTLLVGFCVMMFLDATLG
ncbi:ZIP family metal transporter [Saccharospirillum salsuginis]|uniref:ZIP family metal transporter n=1 Tax=Saccharospirillum salsuginis TaxID=418750 RepID=A0A918K1Y4_9GAMM|nr:ZIP family metal transporter [Saccharospirillum salsuginis]GGX42796.1 ZIP family metal transporter [Saccharospirillum salsuginis]